MSTTRKEKLANVASLFESVAAECEPRKVAIIRKALAELSRETGVEGKRDHLPFSEAETKAIIAGISKYKWGEWLEIKKNNAKLLELRTPLDIRDRALTVLAAFIKNGKVAGCGTAELEILEEYKHMAKPAKAKPTKAASSEEKEKEDE